MVITRQEAHDRCDAGALLLPLHFMKLTLRLLVCSSVFACPLFLMHAQEAVKAQLPRTNHAALHFSVLKAGEVIHMAVHNKEDEMLGHVDDLRVDVTSGMILEVILSTDGALKAVPPRALRHDADAQVLRLDASPGLMRSAPEFTLSSWAEFSDEAYLEKVHRHFGRTPSFQYRPGGEGANGRPDVDLVIIPASRQCLAQTTGRLMGMPVKNLQDETVGTLETLLLDLPAGRVMAFVISSGGFIGLKNELSAVPPAALRFTADKEALQMDATKAFLTRAPHFKRSAWPDFSHPSRIQDVYRAYQMASFFTTGVNAAANTHDTAITTQIRRDVVSLNNVSVSARAVEIVTVKGRVTLLGAVMTDDEKRLIGSIAERIARAKNVDNQLEVRLTAAD